MLRKIIGRNISILYRHENQYVDQRLKEFNINKVQAEVLLFIRDNHMVNHKKINDFFLFNKATITKIISSLEDSGYVERKSSSEDKRQKNIIITQDGKNILPLIIIVLKDWDQLIKKNLSLSQIDMVSSLLAQMVDNMSDSIGEKK